MISILRGGSYWSDEPYITRNTSRRNFTGITSMRFGFRIAKHTWDRHQAMRGGSFWDNQGRVRCTVHDWYLLDLRDSDLGFRVARRKP